MRVALCNALTDCAADPRFVFLTGDLGYNALEPLRDAMGKLGAAFAQAVEDVAERDLLH